MCRVKGKNNSFVETKLETRASIAEEAQDRSQRDLTAVHIKSGGAQERRN